ncbi:MAG: LysR substrate-binding domain-containing protein, partial [Pseudomonadota bacterium]
DLAFHYGDQNWPDTRMIPLFSEEMLPVCTPKYHATHGLCSPAAIHKMRLLHMTSRPHAWSDWFQHAGIQTLPPAPGLRFDQYGMVINAALSGAGVALVPRHMVTPELRTGQLMALGPQMPASKAAYYIVHPTGPLSQSAKAFVTWVQEFTANAEPNGMNKQQKDN